MKHQLVPLGEGPIPYVVSIDYKRPAFDKMVSISSAKEVYEMMLKHLGGETLDHKEKIWLVTLSRANRMLSISLLSVGGISGAILSISEILQTAILTNASGIILVHNHPSGQLKFSESDICLTQKIKQALSHHAIRFLDHVIITSEHYNSMEEENLLT